MATAVSIFLGILVGNIISGAARDIYRSKTTARRQRQLQEKILTGSGISLELLTYHWRRGYSIKLSYVTDDGNAIAIMEATSIPAGIALDTYLLGLKRGIYANQPIGL